MRKGVGGLWTNHAVVYNMFVRSTTAFDHNQNGRIDLPVNEYGWRETGSFLKAIALLPYLRSLGVNTIHLLPITSIGSDGNKGSLGSPYAIKNPFELDPRLSEPIIGLGAEEEFKAFVEGSHHLGIRVVVEFVFRTSAKDGDWVKEHPEWFYWIREGLKDREPGAHDETSYGSPEFREEELKVIKESAGRGDRSKLIPPHSIYRNMFTSPPGRDQIKKENGRYVGVLRDGKRVRIPGAFADWPPDDSQPPWGDVTYLKMYDHPDFNYIAYNTIRTYDTRLAQPGHVNRTLWERIVNIIPYYQRTFGIDGVMIDMGHALPMELKRELIGRAREIDPSFAFWDENFSVIRESVEEGYNAVIGYQWSDQHHPQKFKNLVRRFGEEGYPLPFFATPESHNTPRAASRSGGIRYSQYAWAISNFLPAIPFLHSGFELGEQYPINTGLDFSMEELKQLPSETLPLFSEYAYNWKNRGHCIEWVRRVSVLRKKYESIITDRSIKSFRMVESDSENVIAFERSRQGAGPKLLVIAIAATEHPQTISIGVTMRRRILTDLLSGKKLRVIDSVIRTRVAPGEVLVMET